MVENNVEETGTISSFRVPFRFEIDKDTIPQIIDKHEIWCRRDANKEPTSMPKRITNQCQTGTDKHDETHETIYYSEL